jgi:hypothetical protein
VEWSARARERPRDGPCWTSTSRAAAVRRLFAAAGRGRGLARQLLGNGMRPLQGHALPAGQWPGPHPSSLSLSLSLSLAILALSYGIYGAGRTPPSTTQTPCGPVARVEWPEDIRCPCRRLRRGGAGGGYTCQHRFYSAEGAGGCGGGGGGHLFALCSSHLPALGFGELHLCELRLQFLPALGCARARVAVVLGHLQTDNDQFNGMVRRCGLCARGGTSQLRSSLFSVIISLMYENRVNLNTSMPPMKAPTAFHGAFLNDCGLTLYKMPCRPSITLPSGSGAMMGV